MDIIALNPSFNCKSHPKENVVYLKVNYLQNNDKIFYCETCIEEVGCFVTQNFLRIKNILESDHQLILKWPPLDDNQINLQIKQIISESEKQKNQNIENEIIQLFDQLRKQILEKIDRSQKEMVKLAYEKKIQNDNAFKSLIDFSKIEILQLILKNTQIDCMQKEKQLREIINKAQLQKDQNLQQARKIVNEVNKQNINNKFEIPQHLKQSIFTLIDQINFFNQHQNILPNFKLHNRPFVFSKQQYPKNLYIERLFDNSIEINCKKEDQQQFYSDFVFEKNKKYTFRFEVEATSFQYQCVCIGIIDDKIKYLNYGQYNSNQLIFIQQRYDVKNNMIKVEQKNLKKVKGEWIVKEMKTIELRVDLQNQILEMLDYPNYFHHFSIEDSIKSQLSQNNYRLHLYLEDQVTVRIKNAFICEQFE